MEQAPYQGHAEIVIPSVEVAEQSRVGREIAATRRSRTRNWPEESTHYERFSSFQEYKTTIGDSIHTIGKGMKVGRNLLAYFDDLDDIPRLKFNVRCEHGRSKKLWPNYPHPSEAVIPVGTTLEQLCSRYPLHCWADGLRIFMAENWSAEQIWHGLPHDARNEGASVRKWNYLQQAMGREADKMYEEDENTPRVIIKRKKDEPELEEDDNRDASEEQLNAAHLVSFKMPKATFAIPAFSPSNTYLSAPSGLTVSPAFQQQPSFLQSAGYSPQLPVAEPNADDSQWGLDFDAEFDRLVSPTAGTLSQSPRPDSSQDLEVATPLNFDVQSPDFLAVQDFSTFTPQYLFQAGNSLSLGSHGLSILDCQWPPQNTTALSPAASHWPPMMYSPPAKQSLANAFPAIMAPSPAPSNWPQMKYSKKRKSPNKATEPGEGSSKRSKPTSATAIGGLAPEQLWDPQLQT